MPANTTFAVYEVALKQEASETPLKKPGGFGRLRLPKLPSSSHSRFSISSSSSSSSGNSFDNLDSSLHIRDLVENDSGSCHLSLQNSVDLTRRRRRAKTLDTKPILQESIADVCFDDLTDGSVSSCLSALTIDSANDPIAKKRVRFRLSRNQYRAASEEPLTKEEREAAWWTVDDYNDAVEVTEKFIDDFDHQNKEPMHDLIRLVALCYKSKDGRSIDWDQAVSLTPNVSRGFESEILPPLKHARKRHTKAVLDLAYHHPREDERISEFSSALSKPQTLLGLVYAQRDHQAAMEAVSLPWRKRRNTSSRRK
jgi:hypothetical protein